MAAEFLIGTLLIILTGFIIFKITKSILKAVFLVSSAVILIFIILAALIINDAVEFREQFTTQPSLYLLQEQDDLKAGFSGTLSQQESISFYTDEQLNNFQAQIAKDNLDLGKNYKLFIIKEQAFSIGQIEIGDTPLSKQQIFDLIDSETPLDDFGQPVPIIEKEFKGFLFASLISASLRDNPALLLTQYRKENVIVYPETALFKFVKQIPIENIIIKGGD